MYCIEYTSLLHSVQHVELWIFCEGFAQLSLFKLWNKVVKPYLLTGLRAFAQNSSKKIATVF